MSKVNSNEYLLIDAKGLKRIGVKTSDILNSLFISREPDEASEATECSDLSNIEMKIGLGAIYTYYIEERIGCEFRFRQDDGEEDVHIRKLSALVGRDVTVDEVTRLVDFRAVCYLSEYCDWVSRNSGDFKLVAERVAENFKWIEWQDIQATIEYLEPYVVECDIDIGKMFDNIDWDYLWEDYVTDGGKDETLVEFFQLAYEFFKKYAPELIGQLPRRMFSGWLSNVEDMHREWLGFKWFFRENAPELLEYIPDVDDTDSWAAE